MRPRPGAVCEVGQPTVYGLIVASPLGARHQIRGCLREIFGKGFGIHFTSFTGKYSKASDLYLLTISLLVRAFSHIQPVSYVRFYFLLLGYCIK